MCINVYIDMFSHDLIYVYLNQIISEHKFKSIKNGGIHGVPAGSV